jgi:hypothetical protein
MKCILDLKELSNLRVEVKEHNYDKVKLSIKDDFNKSSVFLSAEEARDLAAMLEQIALQVNLNKF